MFGAATNGTIKNLGVVLSYILGYFNQAGIVGTSGKIINCFSNSIVKGTARTAGVCGNSCTIKNSYNLGDIINGNQDLNGGICGGWCSVYNSYNVGIVSSNANSVGGILGWAGKVYNSFNVGKVVNGSGVLGMETEDSMVISSYNSGQVTLGGIISGEYNISSISNMSIIMKNNYYLKDTANYGINNYASNLNTEPLSQDEMPSVISVINGDNAFVEDTNNINNGYPILKWQSERENN